jgi:hypothetical protein
MDENHPQQARFIHVSSKTAIALMAAWQAGDHRMARAGSTFDNSHLLVALILLL